MRIYLIKSALAAFISIGLASPAAFSGGMDSGGAENHPFGFGSAWFLGSESVNVCIALDNNFDWNADLAVTKVRWALQTWVDYIIKKQVDHIENPLPLSKNFLVKSTCQGNEDLKFYFGISTPETEKIKNSLDNPTAFAYKVDQKLETGRSHGMVWIVNPTPGSDRTKDSRLDAVLLHEIGHTFGNGHVEGTVMNEGIASWLEVHAATPLESEEVSYYSRQIDLRRELVQCWNCTETIQGDFLPEGRPGDSVAKPAKDEDSIQTDYRQLIFLKMFGRPASGEIHSRIERNRNDGIYRLVISDNAGAVTINIDVDFDTEVNLGNVFLRSYLVQNPKSNLTTPSFYASGTFETSVARTLISSAIFPGIGKFQLMITENTEHDFLDLYILDRDHQFPRQSPLDYYNDFAQIYLFVPSVH